MVSGMNERNADILATDGKKVGKVTLPDVFNTPSRPDIIRRAVLAAQSHGFQSQGREVANRA